jgi:four helix bundle protein
MKDEPNGKPSDLRVRTKSFALRVIRLYSALPRTTVAQVIGRQLLRSGTAVGAHYREAWRGPSNAEFISKIQGALQELDETAYSIELIAESSLVKLTRLSAIQREA